jgi:hypothetical protein
LECSEGGELVGEGKKWLTTKEVED